eukprot:2863413-Pyramimonas_sp.AAC.1
MLTLSGWITIAASSCAGVAGTSSCPSSAASSPIASWAPKLAGERGIVAMRCTLLGGLRLRPAFPPGVRSLGEG